MIPVTANISEPGHAEDDSALGKPTGLSLAVGIEPLDEDRHRRSGQRNRSDHEHQAEGHGQKREVVTVATNSSARA